MSSISGTAMQVEFSYTVEDLEEATAAHAGGPFTWKRLGLAGGVAIAAIAAAFVLLVTVSPELTSSRGVPRPRGGTATDVLRHKVLPMAPWLLIFAGLWIYLIRRLRGANKATSSLYPAGTVAPPGPPRSPMSWWLGPDAILPSLLLLAVVTAGVMRGVRESFSTGSRGAAGGSLRGILLGLLPWLVVFGFILFFFIRRRGSEVKRAWEQQPHLQTPKTAEFREDGFAVADALGRGDSRWDAVIAARETPNLFMLYLSDFAYQIVPKRAFRSPADLTDFRELLRRVVVDRPAPAFPVLPASPNDPPGFQLPSPPTPR